MKRQCLHCGVSFMFILWREIGWYDVMYTFKVPITSKNVFHLVQSLYGFRKNATRIFALV